MIRTPAQHNTTNPAGQIVNPVGVVDPTKQGKVLEEEIKEFNNGIHPAQDTFNRTFSGNPK